MKKCPKCQGEIFAKDGKTPAGSQRYRCLNCQKVTIFEPKPIGRKSIGDRPLTLSERVRKYREKKQKDKNND